MYIYEINIVILSLKGDIVLFFIFLHPLRFVNTAIVSIIRSVSVNNACVRVNWIYTHTNHVQI